MILNVAMRKAKADLYYNVQLVQTILLFIDNTGALGCLIANYKSEPGGYRNFQHILWQWDFDVGVGPATVKVW